MPESHASCRRSRRGTEHAAPSTRWGWGGQHHVNTNNLHVSHAPSVTTPVVFGLRVLKSGTAGLSGSPGPASSPGPRLRKGRGGDTRRHAPGLAFHFEHRSHLLLLLSHLLHSLERALHFQLKPLLLLFQQVGTVSFISKC